MSNPKAPFDGWEQDPELGLKLTPVFSVDVQGIREDDVVVFKMQMVADERHLALIRAGKMKPVGLQLSIDPEAARRFASELELAADIAQGRVPSGRDG